MIKTGMVSVTFRQLNPTQVVEITKEAGLQSIEWGGDVHVPHGKIEIAKEVEYITRQAGLEIASYGSYYELGEKEDSFDKVLDSAVMLKVPNIRVWAGNVSSSKADKEQWEKVIQDSKRICDYAKKENINISYEYHCGSLTDTIESTLKLLDEVDRNNVFTYFQPPNGVTVKQNVEDINRLKSKISNVHVQCNIGDVREELIKGIDDWKQYIYNIKKNPKDRYALIEFVKGDEAEQFKEDAQILRDIL